MSSGQKVIKYIAIAFAIFLIVNIVSGILFGIRIFFGVFTGTSVYGEQTSTSEQGTEEITDLDFINKIEIKAGISKLKIEEGEKFTVSIKKGDTAVNVKTENHTLRIESKGVTKWFGTTPSEITIRIPKQREFEKVEIETGVGEAKIESLCTKTLTMEMGVGKVSLSKVQASEKAKIQGGVGVTTIQQAMLNNLQLKGGVGDFDLSAELTGQADIEGGVGNLKITLLGKKEDYLVKSKTGLGTIRVNGQKQEDRAKIGQGDRLIMVTGGIGNITIQTMDF